MSYIVETEISRIRDNPNRDYSNYPIDEEQVERLKASFTDTGGIWHALPARPGADPGTYELCFGHHRVEAARRLNFTKINLEVADRDDDQMILMLATENGTQRVNNAAASMDSVAAITRRLAYLLLRADSFEHLCTIVQRSEAENWFENQRAFDTAKGTLLNGCGIGRDLILKYAPAGSLDRREVESSIATMKADGRYDRIIRDVTDRVRDEREAEEAERERLEEIARRKREAAELREAEAREKEIAEAAKREAAAKAAAEAARIEAEEAKIRQEQAQRDKEIKRAEQERLKAEAAERRQQEAKERQAKLEADRLERERTAALAAEQRKADEAKRKAERLAREAEENKRNEELTALEQKAARNDPKLDPQIVHYFRNHFSLSKFRGIVTDPNNSHWFPVSEQLGHVQAICGSFEKVNPGKTAKEHMTANFVADYLNKFLNEQRRGKHEDEARQKTLTECVNVELTKAIKGASWVEGAVSEIASLLKQGARVPPDFEERLREIETRTTDQIVRLRKISGYPRGGVEISAIADYS